MVLLHVDQIKTIIQRLIQVWTCFWFVVEDGLLDNRAQRCRQMMCCTLQGRYWVVLASFFDISKDLRVVRSKFSLSFFLLPQFADR